MTTTTGRTRRRGLLRLLALSRPRFWVYLLGPYLVGLAAAGARPGPALILLGVYLTLPANLLIYGVNDLFDRPTDRLNEKKGSYEALLDPAEDRGLLAAILGTNLPFLALVPFLPLGATVWLVVFLVLGIGYSAPPLRFKVRPGLDSASNFLYAAPGFAAYTAVAPEGPAPLLVVAAALWCAAMHAYSAVPDIEADRAAGISTVATGLGARRAVLCCILLWLGAAALLLPWLPLVAAIGAMAYVLLGAASLRAIVGARPSLFALYRVFPLVNTALGAALFFAVWFPHQR